MKVVVFEDNLMWSSRLAKSIDSLGHEPIIISKADIDIPAAEVAIVNLGSPTFSAAELIPTLKKQGTHVIGHAGHKETPLLEFGRDSGCDQIVSNSSLTFRLADILKNAR